MLAVASIVLLLGTPRPVVAEDETQACDANGQAVAYGDVRVGCSIEPVTDLDVFTFVGAVGDEPTVVITKTVGPSTAICAEIRGPGGSLLAGPTCHFLTLRFDLNPLPLAGVHQIIVTDLNNDHTGGFNMSIERIFPLRSPSPIGPDDVIVGRQILPITDLDTFSFNANLGDELRLILTKTAGPGLAVCAEVRGPGNVPVVDLTCHFSSLDLLLPAAPVGGTYQLLVRDQNDDHTLTYNLSLNCLSGTCADRPPACIVDPGYAGNTLTLNFTVGTADPTTWHVALLAFGNVYTLWKAPLPTVDPAVDFSLPIPGVPSIGTIGVLSTFTSPGGLICTDLKTVDTGPMTLGMTPELLRQWLGPSR